MEFKILELFSGIGGMHYAFDYSKLSGSIVAAYDINPNANAVYIFNHPETVVRNNNIQSLTPESIEKLGVNMILMSPPCQPHTRVGKKLDVNDNRSDGLQHICTLLPKCARISHILMENVKGFENSQARMNFVEALTHAGFHYCEFILSPTQFGVPNTRNRYYCLARKDKKFNFSTGKVLEHIPIGIQNDDIASQSLHQLIDLEITPNGSNFVNDNDLLKRVNLMDIVTLDDKNTMCFTKAYTHYAEGTGSVFTPLNRSKVDDIFQNVKLLENDDERLSALKQLRLRYFTSKEVARLMSFPSSFEFPPNTTDRQQYRLLGNSINVLVVGELIKLLCS